MYSSKNILRLVAPGQPVFDLSPGWHVSWVGHDCLGEVYAIFILLWVWILCMHVLGPDWYVRVTTHIERDGGSSNRSQHMLQREITSAVTLTAPDRIIALVTYWSQTTGIFGTAIIPFRVYISGHAPPPAAFDSPSSSPESIHQSWKKQGLFREWTYVFVEWNAFNPFDEQHINLCKIAS